MITVPEGPIGLTFIEPMRDPTYGNRIQWFTYHLQDNDGAPKGALIGVTGGSLEWHANAQVRAGGKITVQQESREDHDWTKRRVKIVMHIDGLGDYPLGVFIPSAPTEDWDDTNLTLTIELLDKCSVLSEDYVEETYTLAEGTNVTTAVRSLINAVGEQAGSITDGSETLSSAMTWDAGTSRLTIINDLLQAADYFALYADGDGNFRVEKQRAAASRPIRYEFIDNYRSIYLPQFKFDKDIYSIPNKVIVIGQGTEEEEAPVAVATNENPNSPYSYQSRGRWITDVLKGVEATSEDSLQSHANRRLRALSSPQGTLTISHAPLPWLDVNDAVRFKRDPADFDMRCVVQSVQMELNETSLAVTSLLEVVDL